MTWSPICDRELGSTMPHGATSSHCPPRPQRRADGFGDAVRRASPLLTLLVCTVHCGGAQPPAGLTRPSEPAADPSAKVTVQSASRPNRSATADDPGRDVAKQLLTPVSDCDVTMCTGDAPSQLIASIRARAGEARSCYEESLKSDSSLKGRVRVALRVTREGKTCPIKLEENELAASTTLLPCLRALLEQSYPRPLGGCVDMSLPLKFVPEFVEPDGGVAFFDQRMPRSG